MQSGPGKPTGSLGADGARHFTKRAEDAMTDRDDDAAPSPGHNLAEVFDLDRKGTIKALTDDMERALFAVEQAREDLREIKVRAREAEFTPKEIAAMARIAKLRADDKVGDAREQMEALERVSGATGVDLFSWQG